MSIFEGYVIFKLSNDNNKLIKSELRLWKYKKKMESPFFNFIIFIIFYMLFASYLKISLADI